MHMGAIINCQRIAPSTAQRLTKNPQIHKAQNATIFFNGKFDMACIQLEHDGGLVEFGRGLTLCVTVKAVMNPWLFVDVAGVNGRHSVCMNGKSMKVLDIWNKLRI